MEFLDDVRQYVQLKAREEELAARLKSVKEESDKVQERLMERFADESIDRMTVDGRTVYLHRQLWAGYPDRPNAKTELVEAMRDADLGHFVYETFNTNTLSAYVRELESEGRSIPPELVDRIKVSEVYSLRVRKAN